MPSSSWEKKRLHLRPALVWSIALSSLRLRLGRTVLTLLTVTASCAFVLFLLTTPATDPDEQEKWALMLALSLVVSMAGVLNTMLMSVTQRYREIGTLKCLGALDSFVLLSVLLVTDELAEESGRASLVPFWLSRLPADRAAAVGERLSLLPEIEGAR